jgi:hypothetical protein
MLGMQNVEASVTFEVINSVDQPLWIVRNYIVMGWDATTGTANNVAPQPSGRDILWIKIVF